MSLRIITMLLKWLKKRLIKRAKTRSKSQSLIIIIRKTLS